VIFVKIEKFAKRELDRWRACREHTTYTARKQAST